MSDNKEKQDTPTKLLASTALNAVLDDDRVIQAVVVVLTEDGEYVRTKGHFYDNATLLNSILGDFREKVYMDVFSGPKTRLSD